MKRTLSIVSLLLCGLMLFTACGSDDTKNPETTASSTTEEPAATTIELVYDPKASSAKTVTGETSVEMTVSKAYKTGDKITVTLPEGQHYLAICLAKDVVEESIVYLPNSVFTYTAQNVSVSYPSEMNGQKCTITARIPTADELAASRNLALNPADLIDATAVFPHVSTTSVHDINNESNRLQFESRNVIDGFTQNNGHGGYPFQSWGPASNMGPTDNLIIDFGREVTLTELVVYLRADFPHDTYWKSCVVIFSDGSKQTLNFEKIADAQSITFDAPVTTSSLKFTRFSKEAGSDWAAWMEVQAIGSDIVG